MRKVTPPGFRFWPKVNVDTQDVCWEWKKPFKTFYPQFCWGGRGSATPGHIAAYRLYHGSVPEGAYICHRCENRKCCNPHHLYAGTQKENVRDAIKSGRFKFLERRQGVNTHNAKLTEAEVKQIRECYHQTPYKERGAFAASFGISRTHARRIAIGQGWNHVPH